ncbi:MAG: ubiquinone biosynthesis monooxygenase [Planctomycetota bacterium]|jgi:hypothetical protein
MPALLATAAAGWRLLGTARAGLAVRAARRSGDGHAVAAARERLAHHLAEARGVSAKLGQWLAGGRDGAAYAGCCEGLAPLPWDDLAPAVDVALADAPWWRPAVVAPRGIAASLGQVHRVVLADGRAVAVKVRYPGMPAAAAAELAALALLPAGGPMRAAGLDLAAHKALLRDTIEGELDYRREADAQRAWPGSHGVVVPAVLAAGDGVLVQSWEDGATLAEAAGWDRAVRNRLGEALLTHCLARAAAGRVHADLHPGNLRFRPDGSVVLLDFGCTAPLPAAAWAGVLAAIRAVAGRGDADPLACLAAAGFDPVRLAHLRDQLPAVLAEAFAPFAAPGRRDLAAWRPGERIAAVLGDLRWWFRAAGPVGMLLPTRSWAGLGRILRGLDARIDWQACLEAACPGALESAPAPALPAGAAAGPTMAGLARELRVRVVRDGVETVRIALPAACIHELGSLLGDDLHRGLAARGIDPAAIAGRAIRAGLRPGPLFTDDDGRRAVAVELA